MTRARARTVTKVLAAAGLVAGIAVTTTTGAQTLADPDGGHFACTDTDLPAPPECQPDPSPCATDTPPVPPSPVCPDVDGPGGPGGADPTP